MTEKQKLIRKLDEIFSKYIRLRDMMSGRVFRCVSCGRVLPIEQADCGHYINRKHMATRFSEVNCNAQCRSCNRFDEGNMSGYRAGLVAKRGENMVTLLEAQRNEARKWEVWEMKAAIEHYKREVKRLEAEKGKLLCGTR
ncbi:MAG: recombination protein NinG [Bacteroidaceae bacterium]|nr:recombination protein NinG [Bacteroidaceae bacterium]